MSRQSGRSSGSDTDRSDGRSSPITSVLAARPASAARPAPAPGLDPGLGPAHRDPAGRRPGHARRSPGQVSVIRAGAEAPGWSAPPPPTAHGRAAQDHRSGPRGGPPPGPPAGARGRAEPGRARRIAPGRCCADRCCPGVAIANRRGRHDGGRRGSLHGRHHARHDRFRRTAPPPCPPSVCGHGHRSRISSRRLRRPSAP